MDKTIENIRHLLNGDILKMKNDKVGSFQVKIKTAVGILPPYILKIKTENDEDFKTVRIMDYENLVDFLNSNEVVKNERN